MFSSAGIWAINCVLRLDPTIPELTPIIPREWYFPDAIRYKRPTLVSLLWLSVAIRVAQCGGSREALGCRHCRWPLPHLTFRFLPPGEEQSRTGCKNVATL